jgi:DNA polymerase-4
LTAAPLRGHAGVAAARRLPDASDRRGLDMLSTSHNAPRAIIHVDMDAFYASVEMRDQPALRGRPVLVGGTPRERGVVAAASYEARAFGVRSAMSSHRALRLCPDAVLLPPRMDRYVEISRQIFGICERFTPLIERLSIDEAFLDVTGSQRLFGPAAALGRLIKAAIRDETGLTASVGVAPNKFLAKLGSDLRKPDGFVVIEADAAAGLLAGLPVQRLWGVGEVTARRLAQQGIVTVRDLLARPAGELERLLGDHAADLRALALGLDDRPVVPDAEAKSIGAETTFPEDVADENALRDCLDRLIERVAHRLRHEGCRARTVQLKARYPDFTTVTRSLTLPEPTARGPELRAAARALLAVRLDRRGRPLRLLGVSVSQLESSDDGSPELFADAAGEKVDRVDKLLDELRDRYGPGALRRGAPGGRKRGEGG